MALRGNLESLQATDILQFLTQSGKSGTLQVCDAQRTKLLSFADGHLTYAVHQHQLPPLKEVLYQRGLLSREEFSRRRDRDKFDVEMTKALERRRGSLPTKSGGDGSGAVARLGKILVKRGSLRQEDLDLVLEPEHVPDRFLEKCLFQYGAVSVARMLEVRQAVDTDVSLFQALLNEKVLTREEVEDAIACMSERTLADLLVFHGYVKRGDAHFCAGQLEALRAHARPQLRLGDYLVATGMVSAWQLEKALAEQLSHQKLLGEILVEHGIVAPDAIDRAEHEMTRLRGDFSPLQPLDHRLCDTFGFTCSELQELHRRHRKSDRLFTDILRDAKGINEEALETTIQSVLVDEISDLDLWAEGSYEFFEGFSLEDAVQIEGISRIHGYTFEAGRLLLEAHHQVDELNATGFRDVKLETILVASGPDALDREADALGEEDRRLIAQLDGRRPVAEICRTVPGNTLADRRLMFGFVQRGLATPLTREEAWLAGQSSVAASDFVQALRFFEHALVTVGGDPSDSSLRVAIHDARLASNRHLVFRRGLFSIRRSLRLLAEWSQLQRLGQWVAGRRSVIQARRRLRANWDRYRTALAYRSMLWGAAFEDFVLKRGLGRQWWSLKTWLLHPAQRVAASSVARVTLMVATCVSIGAALLLPGIPHLDEPAVIWKPRPPREVYPIGREPKETRDALFRLICAAPAPAGVFVLGTAIYVTGRDGLLCKVDAEPVDRAIPPDVPATTPGEAPVRKPEWSVVVGEYGDLLSTPLALDDGEVYVNNVRGTTTAITDRGELRWQIRFPRLEPLPPIALRSQALEGGLTAIAVIARETLVVVSRARGETLYRLETGNRIACVPIGSGEQVFVGSNDNHVYCADWVSREVVWSQPVGDDVRELLLLNGTLIAAIRGDSLVALDAETGDPRWQQAMGGKNVVTLSALGTDRLCVETARGEIQVLDLETGEPLSSFAAHPSLGVVGIRMHGGRYVYLDEKGHVGQLDGAGAHLWRSSRPLEAITGWQRGDRHVVVTTQDGLVEIHALLPAPPDAPPGMPLDTPDPKPMETEVR